MELDLHYHALYALARCSGLARDPAVRIATASQYVDDFTVSRWLHLDGVSTCIYPTAIPADAGEGRLLEHIFIEIPFHFLPGGQGNTFHERLTVRPGSYGVTAMLEHCFACRNPHYTPELMGIAAHVLMDSYAHAGFSGLPAPGNASLKGSVELQTGSGGWGRPRKALSLGVFLGRHLPQNQKESVGHSSVGNLPDLPYARWRADFIEGGRQERNNPDMYLNGCRALYGMLGRFAALWSGEQQALPFSALEEGIRLLLETPEPDMLKRCAGWNTFLIGFMPDDALPSYEYQRSQLDKDGEPFQRFCRAAMYYRDAVLGVVLPDMGISLATPRGQQR